MTSYADYLSPLSAALLAIGMLPACSDDEGGAGGDGPGTGTATSDDTGTDTSTGTGTGTGTGSGLGCSGSGCVTPTEMAPDPFCQHDTCGSPTSTGTEGEWCFEEFCEDNAGPNGECYAWSKRPGWETTTSCSIDHGPFSSDDPSECCYMGASLQETSTGTATDTGTGTGT